MIVILKIAFSDFQVQQSIMINMVPVRNPLAPFCGVLGKDTLRQFPLLGGLGKQF